MHNRRLLSKATPQREFPRTAVQLLRISHVEKYFFGNHLIENFPLLHRFYELKAIFQRIAPTTVFEFIYDDAAGIIKSLDNIE